MAVSCRQPQLRVFKSLKPQLCHENMSYWASHSFGNCKNDFSLLVRGRYLQDLTTWSLLSASQWDLVIINQKTKNKSKRPTMQLLSYKNLSRNLASRVAERLFISCLCDSAGSDDSCENLIVAPVLSHLVRSFSWQERDQIFITVMQ